MYYFLQTFIRLMKKINEVDETEIFNNLNNEQNLTENDIRDIDIKSQLEHQIQNQKTKNLDGFLTKLIQAKKYFIKLVN